MSALGWALVVIAAVIVVSYLISSLPVEPHDPFESEFRRIEREVHHARREIDRLESEANRAMDEAQMRHRLGGPR